MKNKIIIVMGIVISMSLTACQNDSVDVIAQLEETSQSIEESSIEEETTTEAESETEEETTTEIESTEETTTEIESTEETTSTIDSSSELAGQEGEVTTDEDLIDLNDLVPEDWGFSTQEELDAWISEMVGEVVGDSSSGGSTGGTSKDIPQAAKDMYHGVDDGNIPDSTFGQGDYSGLSTTGISY